MSQSEFPPERRGQARACSYLRLHNKLKLAQLCLSQREHRKETPSGSQASGSSPWEQRRVSAPGNCTTVMSLQPQSNLGGTRRATLSPSFPDLLFYLPVNGSVAASVTRAYLPDCTYFSPHCWHYLCSPFFRVRRYMLPLHEYAQRHWSTHLTSAE